VVARCKVLVAESDAKASMALARHLKSRGYEVVSANEAISVLKVARDERPDVIVMNNQLGGGGATVALKRVRSNVFTTHIPVLVVVGRSGARPKELMNVGAQECLSNPVDAQALAQAIEKHRLQDLDFTEAPRSALADKARLADLKATKLLDTPADESFDRLTRLASKLLRTPAAMMTLIDKDRQFVKSQVGAPDRTTRERQKRLSHSFCQWVVSGKEAMVVPDATEHPVLKSNLAVRDMGIVAYCGTPLAGRTGQAIGSFCAVDMKPREWTEDDLATLRDLANLTEAYATLHRAKGKSATASLETVAHIAGNAILSAAHIVRRHGSSLDDADRNMLLEIIEEQSRHLVETVPDRPH
jgi:CheY-like chemotaxis protein